MLGELETLAKSYGLVVAVLLAGSLALAYVIRQLYTDNQALHAKLIQLLDERGKYLDSILSEAIGAQTTRRNP